MLYALGLWVVREKRRLSIARVFVLAHLSVAVWPISATWRTSRVDTWTFSSALSDIFNAIWLLEYIARQAYNREFPRTDGKKISKRRIQTKWKPLTYSCLSQITLSYNGARPNTPNTPNATLPDFFLPLPTHLQLPQGGGYNAEKTVACRQPWLNATP